MKAVQVLLASRAKLNSGKSSSVDIKVDGNGMEIESQEVDPIQVSFFRSSRSKILLRMVVLVDWVASIHASSSCIDDVHA